MRYRLFVLDVDGTLIGSSGEVRPRVAAAIGRAQGAGVAVAICTGRPMASCRPFVERLRLAGPQVVVSGALVRDVLQGRTVMVQPLEPAVARRIVEFSREQGVCAELYTEKTHYVERDWEESRLHAISVRVDYEVAPFEPLIASTRLVKAQLIASETATPGIVAGIAERLGDAVDHSVATPMAPCEGLRCINVVARGVSKGHAVRALIDHHGLERARVAGFGDAPNDLDMFAEVGWRVAMGNADDAVKALADEVCGHVDADGLAEAIEGLLDRG